MRVESIRVVGRNLPMTLLEVAADDGAVGIGGADAPETLLRPIIEQPPWRLAALVVGRDPCDVEHISRDMCVACLGQGGLVVHAQAGLDMALWDLRAKCAGVPLSRLLSEGSCGRVLPYASATAFDLSRRIVGPLEFKSTDRLVAEARQRVQEGFRAIKFGWGNHFAPADLARIAAIRQAIGMDVKLMIDFGGPDYLGAGVTVEPAARIAALLEPYALTFLEEPLPPWDAEGYARLRCASPVPVATGEMLCESWEFDRFIDGRAVDVIQPDAYRVGVTRTLRVARRAREAGMGCVPHSPWSVLAVAAHLHILSAVYDESMVEYPSASLYSDTVRHGEFTRLATNLLVEHPIQPQDGWLRVPGRPGLGLGGFRRDAIARMEALAAEGLER